MNTGYSSKIYKQNKKKYSVPVLVSVLAVIILYFLFSPGEGEKPGKDQAISEIKEKQVKAEEPEEDSEEVEINPGFAENSETPLPESDEPEPDIKGYSNVLTNEEIKNLDAKALVYVKSENYVKALSIYKELLSSNEKYLTSIGMCYYRMKEYESAIENFENSLEKGFFPFMNKKFLAYSYYETDDLERSREYAEEALRIKPDKKLDYLLNKLKTENKVMEDYKEQGLTNFVIKFSKLEHSETRSIVSDQLKEAYREIGKQLDFFPDISITVILYNEKDFFDVTRAPGWAGGLFDGKIRIPVRGASENKELLKRVIFHEYSHVVVSEIAKKCPLWIDEGLAEYFSNENPEKIGQIIPFRKLEKGFPAGSTQAVSVAYRQSHSAVSYLIEKYGLYSIKDLLIAFGEGKSLNKAFESVFYISYDTFVDSWGKNN